MTSIQILQLFTILINIVLILRSVMKYWRIDTSRAWIYSYSFLTLWAVCDLFQNIAGSPAVSVFWSRGTDVTATLASIYLLRFVLISVHPDFIKKHTLMNIHMFVGLVLCVIGTVTPWFTYESVPTWWGYYPHHTVWFYVLNIYTVGNGLLVLLLPVVRFSTLNDRQQKQMRLFVLGYLIPIVGGTLSEVVAPALSLQVPPLTTILFSITGVCMAYAIEKYHFFSFTPSLVLKDIFNTIKDILSVLDMKGRIVLTNARVCEVTGRQLQDLIDHNITEILYNKANPELPVDYFINTPFRATRMYMRSTSRDKDLSITLDSAVVRDKFESQGVVLYGRDMTQTDILFEELQMKTMDLEKSKSELEHQIHEIEKINAVMIGRELKMAEMKKEMTALEAKIASKPYPPQATEV